MLTWKHRQRIAQVKWRAIEGRRCSRSAISGDELPVGENVRTMKKRHGVRDVDDVQGFPCPKESPDHDPLGEIASKEFTYRTNRDFSLVEFTWAKVETCSHLRKCEAMPEFGALPADFEASASLSIERKPGQQVNRPERHSGRWPVGADWTRSQTIRQDSAARSRSPMFCKARARLAT